VLFVFLRPDPLLLARAQAGLDQVEPEGTSWGRVRAVVAARPSVGAAIAGMTGAHAVMVAVMVMTPLHMEHGGATLRIIGVVISLHVLGMFAFAPVVGIAADRLGRAPVLWAGGGILLVALLLCGAAPEGSSWEIFAGLFLLGLGWSAATVAASTLLTEHSPLDARTDVQGAADLIMGLTAAAAGGLAGLIVGSYGFSWLNGFAAIFACGVLVAAALAHRPDPVLTKT
jgi:MFS family permease